MRLGVPVCTALAACAALIACGQGEPHGRTTIDTTSGGAVIDSSRHVATTVAAMLTDENVIALMDSSYAAALQLDTLAQDRASDPRIKTFVTHEIPEHNLILRASKDLTDRLQISPVLPDRAPLRDFAQAMRELRAKSGADFDRTYLDRTIKMHEDLLDEVNDGLKGRQTEAVRTFLDQVKRNVETDLNDLRKLRDQVGK